MADCELARIVHASLAHQNQLELTMFITEQFLRDNGACNYQTALFARTFPDGAETTAENLLHAMRAGLNTEWIIRFIPQSALYAFGEATARVWHVYRETMASAECAEARASARRVYDEAMATALAKCLP